MAIDFAVYLLDAVSFGYLKKYKDIKGISNSIY